MPLSLSNRDQNSGHLFYNRRLRAATTRFSVRMKHDDRKQTAALALSVVLVAIAAGWMVLLNVLKPSGVVGDSAIIGDRESGAIYARIDGRLYPALNLTSARLATGTAGQPTWVKPAEIAKYPTGPLLGIPGAPAAMPVNRGAVSAWAACDTAGRPRTADKPAVTSIAGQLTGGRATPMANGAGLMVTFERATYVIWDGKRSQVDPADRAVTLSLGLDPGVTVPSGDLARALRRPTCHRAPACAEGARGGNSVEVATGLTGGRGAAGPNGGRRHAILRIAGRWCAKGRRLRGRSAAQRQLLRSDNAADGDSRRAGQHSRSGFPRRRLLPEWSAEFR